MKNILFSVLFMCFAGQLAAQVNYDNVVLPEEVRPRNFEEYLVQTAWQNTPDSKIAEIEKSVAEIEQKQEKWNWVNDVNASFNVNPSSSNIIVIDGQQFFQPGVTYGVGFNVGGLLTSGFERKIAAKEVEIADAKINQQKLAIRALVLKAYESYKLSNQILESRFQAEEDASAAYTIISELFKKNRAEVRDYTNASSNYFAAKEARQTAEAEVQNAIIDLEELIGVDWETAQRFENVYGTGN